jgi:CRP-like cAMP-binding protein
VTIEDDIAMLARVPTFAQLGFSALQILAIGSESKLLAEGETLFRAGETTDAGYVIQEGSLLLIADDQSASATFGPGTLVGELALLTRSLFRKVLEGFPNAARVMRDRFSERAGLAGDELSRMRAILQKPS